MLPTVTYTNERLEYLSIVASVYQDIGLKLSDVVCGHCSPGSALSTHLHHPALKLRNVRERSPFHVL